MMCQESPKLELWVLYLLDLTLNSFLDDNVELLEDDSFAGFFCSSAFYAAVNCTMPVFVYLSVFVLQTCLEIASDLTVFN